MREDYLRILELCQDISASGSCSDKNMRRCGHRLMVNDKKNNGYQHD